MIRSSDLIGKKKGLCDAIDSLLRALAFENRYVLHPRRMSEIGAELVDAFLHFLDAPAAGVASAHGAQLAQEGLGEGVILKLASELRTFCRRELSSDGGASDVIQHSAESFSTSLLEGYIAARKTQILTDQEQLRRALSTALFSQSQELLVKNHAVNTSINGIILSDLGGKVTWVNPSFLRMWGIERAEDVLGTDLGDFLDWEEGPAVVETLPQTGGWHGQLAARRGDGGRFSVEVSVSLIRDDMQNAIGVMTSVIDITEHLKAEEMTKNLLLVKEIHHRIKNNLQVISSLLYLQSGYVQEAKAREMFKESQDRVRSMALLHEKLYQSKSLGGVAFPAYVSDLTRSLFQSYGIQTGIVDLELEDSDITLGMDTAVPCGLIINELVTNSLKHAFPSRQPGRISITIHPTSPVVSPSDPGSEEKWFRLTVSDNGRGFPRGLDFRATESLGLKLVCTLTEQLCGTIELDRSAGTCFIIRFKEL